MTDLKKGKELLGPNGQKLPTKEERHEAELEQASNVAIVDESNPELAEDILNRVAKVIKPSTITPHPERIYCMKVNIDEFKSKNGLFMPSVYQIAGARSGQNGAKKELFRLFVIGIGSMVNKCLDTKPGTEIKLGDEAFLQDTEGVEKVYIPYVTDFDEFGQSSNIDSSFFFSLHFTELHGWKAQPIVRKVMYPEQPMTGLCQ